MTSTPVNNVKALMNYVNHTGNADTKTGDAVKETFGKIMGKVNDDLNNLTSEAVAAGAGTTVGSVKAAESAPKQEAVSKNDSYDKSSDVADNKPSGNGGKDSVQDKTVNDAKEQQAQDTVRESGEKLVEEIAEEMGVTPEEVEAVMAALGMTAIELFDPENMKQLLLAISGNGDQLSLVTNEDLYMNLQNLFATATETLEGLQQELGLSEEDLNALVEQMISDGKEMTVQDGDIAGQPTTEVLPETLPEDLPEAMPEEQEELTGPEGMKDYTVSIQKDGNSVQVKVQVDDESGAKSVQETVTDADTQKTTVQSGVKTGDKNAFENNRREGGSQGEMFLQTLVRQENVSEAPAVSENFYQSTQTNEIMDQIMEYMKINLRADVHEVEMQLHPASLGTVNVQIAAKEGVVTAQFTTQNEVVRAAIESQLIQLKQQFEEQGIKIDAVEVTVASHEYDQQYDQSSADTRQDQKKSGKGSRRINLDELDAEEDLEEMEDSERISVEMMRANGGTVDYMA